MCPSCQGRKLQPETRGVDADGRTLRDYLCLDCAHRFTTVEIATPVRLFVLDPHRRWRNRLNMRRRRGYRGLPGRPIQLEPRLIASVRVVPR